MGSRDQDPPSFDPRTWRGSFEELARESSKPEAGAVTPGPTFDPKSWADGAAEPSGPEARARRTARVKIAAGAGAALGVALAGAAIVLLRPDSPAPAPAPKAAANPSAAPAAAAPEDAAEPTSRRTLILTGPRQAGAALAAAGLAAETAAAATNYILAALGQAPGEIRLSYEIAGRAPPFRLVRLEATRGDGSGIALHGTPGGALREEKLAASLRTRIRAVTGQMDETNFYSSAVTAGIDDSLISDFAKALAFDFNFQTEIRPGDVFGAAIEQASNAAGRPVGLPRLVYVSMRTETKMRALYSFAAPGEGEPGWYDANGRSASRSLMRTPVDGARISSRFGPRFHPVLHFMKKHNGIDFAAPTGTPIYASGSGVVVWAAMKGANGNLTVLRHDNGWLTLYLHQSRFMPGVAPGARVSQGQKIGEIGTTGRSTGPHLHYEVHIDGVAVDPQSIDTGSGVSLEGAALARFKAERERIDRARAAAQ
ncbi:MAG TPA: peptidoglycan DD-metalloendopeptidase family protein [Allosphingosinicella sp.]|jgi:murein DD-endopeptidase MepM/ murein hydrolase activator NlpD